MRYLKIKDYYKLYSKTKLEDKIEDIEYILESLNYIDAEVKKSLNEEIKFIVIENKNNSWNLAFKIFLNQDWKSRGDRYPTNIYHLNFLGLLKLQHIIKKYNRKLNKYLNLKNSIVEVVEE